MCECTVEFIDSLNEQGYSINHICVILEYLTDEMNFNDIHTADCEKQTYFV